MGLDIKSIQQELKRQAFLSDIHSFVIFGSSTRRPGSPKDTDICLVLKNPHSNQEAISKFIFNTFINPDITIYLKEEVESSLPFTDIGNGVFALEYLSRGICIFGDNIFKNKMTGIDLSKYYESLLVKAFEYVLRLRTVFFSEKYDSSYRFTYFEKYVTRLTRMVLLYKNYVNYDSVESLTRVELLSLAKNKGILKGEYDFNLITFNDYFRMFEEVNKYLIGIKEQ